MRALDLVGLGERHGAGMRRVAVQLFAGAYVFVEQPGVGHQPRASVNVPTHSRL